MPLEIDTPARPPLPAHPPWYVRLVTVSFRTLLLTLLFAMLGMAVGLLVGIIGTVVMAAVHHTQPDMTYAYRHVAIPAALASAGVAFAWNLVRAVIDAVRGR
jgi:hypothetical protein